MTKKLAFLGYGLRSKTMLQAFREIEADISVAAVADPRCCLLYTSRCV